MKNVGHIVCTLVFPVAALAIAPAALAGDGQMREIGRTTEKELNVVISTSLGKLVVSKGDPEKILLGEPLRASGKPQPFQMDYTIRNRIGYLDLSFSPEHAEGDRRKESFSFSDLANKWHLRFSEAIPITFDIQMGVAKGDFDLTGLRVKDFNLSSGASDVQVAFHTPNPMEMNELNIESGVGKFEGVKLGNGNFRRFHFEGGLGTATLDFSGGTQREMDIDVQVGMGVCTIILPSNAGAKIYCEQSFVSRLDYSKDFYSFDENSYISENYKSAATRMNIRIEAGFGSVKIRRN